MTIEHPYATWVEADDDGRGGATHAVAVTDGIAAPITLCGETIVGSVEGLFGTTGSPRCRYCADVLGLERQRS